jgi:2-phospho-L-lactate guanylyltransferase
MMRWTAVVPLKLGPNCKSRLAPLFSPDQRRRLLQTMAGHVVEVLCDVSMFDDVVLIGLDTLPDWSGTCIPDAGRGLNAELNAVAATIDHGLLIILGDLPCLKRDEIAALLVAAEDSGCAIAPDRHGQGTNALALRQVPAGISFAFGDDSFAKHCAQFGHSLTVVEREGLACDLDTPADYAFAVSRGYWSHSPTA